MLLASCVGAAETVPSHSPHRKSFNMLQLSCYAFSGRGMGLVNVLVKNNPSCFLLPKVISTGLLIFRGKKNKISRGFQGQIRGKIGRFRGIFAGKKSKFAAQSADFGRFSRERSQNSRKIGPFRGILVEKSQFSKDFQGQILRKIGRFQGKFRGETSPRNNQ